jgi:uncharacterized protein
MIERVPYLSIWDDLSPHRQMVFIAGPRQTGKTTLTEQIRARFASSAYLNWDEPEHRHLLTDRPHFYEEIDRKDSSKPVVVLDELHKYGDWKNYLKGIYDRDSHQFKFVVSGSGRLEAFQKGGDSLAGRYFLFHLWPLTLGELANRKTDFDAFWANPLEIPEEHSGDRETWQTLDRLSGFPDPFTRGTERFYRIWSRNYRSQLLREELRDLAEIRKFTSADLLYSLLPGRVGSPLSMQNLAGDIQVSFDTVKNWLAWFDQLFLSFRISPWSQKIPRAISKEKKLYLFDYGSIESQGAKLENQVAVELWRAVHGWNDMGLGEYSLHFLRNKQREEVDFLICDRNRPKLLIEVKTGETSPDGGLRKFQALLQIPAVQLVEKEGICRIVSNDAQKIMVVSASRYLSTLP